MGTVALVKMVEEARSDGKVPIKIRVGHRRRYGYETICYVKDTHWNASARRVLPYDPQHRQLNELLEKRFGEVRKLVAHYDEHGWPYTAQDILRIDYAGWVQQEQKTAAVRAASVPGKSMPGGLLQFIEDVVVPYWDSVGNPGNAEKYQMECDMLREYLSSLKPRRVDILMSKLDTPFIESYFAWLRSKPLRPCRKDSTLRRRLSQIEAVLNVAIRKGAIASVPILEPSLDVQKARKPKLLAEQIRQMEDHVWDFTGVTGKQFLSARQADRLATHTFLIQYYLYGARVGDVFLLRNSNVISRSSQPVKVEYYQQKGRKAAGKKLMSVTIAPRLVGIIRQYWNPADPDGYLLPWLRGRYETDFTRSEVENAHALRYAIHQATSAMNAALRRACAVIGLDVARLASHSARHSYAQRAKQKGKSIEWIKETLGHSTYDITATYLADLDSDELNKNMLDVYD